MFACSSQIIDILWLRKRQKKPKGQSKDTGNIRYKTKKESKQSKDIDNIRYKTKKESKQYKQKHRIQKAKTRTAKIIDEIVLSVHGKHLML